jgi:magnesium-transporting ATPase (P-type)
MKAKASILSRVSWLLVLVAVLFPAGNAAAQDNSSGGAAGAALMGGFFLIFVIIAIVFYVYVALALQTIAQKTNTENGWLAWIPIANVILMCNIARKPVWWIVLCLIPLVNVVIYIILWMGIAEARNKPSWWGILIIVPVANLIVPGYLAWAD